MPRVYASEPDREYARILRNINGELHLRKITQKTLSKEIGMDRATLGMKLNNKRALTVIELLRIEEALGEIMK